MDILSFGTPGVAFSVIAFLGYVAALRPTNHEQPLAAN